MELLAFGSVTLAAPVDAARILLGTAGGLAMLLAAVDTPKLLFVTAALLLPTAVPAPAPAPASAPAPAASAGSQGRQPGPSHTPLPGGLT